MLTIRNVDQVAHLSDESKNIIKQLVDMEILYLLNFGARSGYELRKQLQSAFGINVSYGTLYPHLHSLEKARFIEGRWSSKEENASLRKRVYSLTKDGTTILRACVESLAKISLTMQFMLTKVNLNPESAPNAGRDVVLGLAERFLNRQGYTTQRSVSLKGASGVQHAVELLATKTLQDSGVEAERILVRAASGESGVTMDDILRTYVMSYDLSASNAVILTTPVAHEDILKLGEFYRIMIYDGKTWDETISNLTSHFSFN